MTLDIAAVQKALQSERLDGWLLYDFHGSNPIAQRLAGLAHGVHMTTRRWYFLIPASGQPRALVHAIERHNLDHLPGTKTVYSRREELESGLSGLLRGVRRVAMEYSPDGAIPYVSRVDGGTLDAIRHRHVEVVSSGDLVQQFEATWTAEQLATHRHASEALYRIKDRAFEAAAAALGRGLSLSEFDLQQQMAGWFTDEGLISDSPPVVAVGAHAGNPHYLPTSSDSGSIVADRVLLLDLWGKQPTPGAVFADITWVAVTSARVPDEVAAAFQAIADARDTAVRIVSDAARDGGDLRGWEVDRAARSVLERSGYTANILHRTGHSLGENVHGNGTHLDDFETHDDRRILADTGFTVEPGVYFERFGVRTEINVYRTQNDAIVTGPRQMAVVTLR
jgi:Xaa-Pro aminopeptidase